MHVHEQVSKQALDCGDMKTYENLKGFKILINIKAQVNNDTSVRRYSVKLHIKPLQNYAN